jgi:hypothetical protein
MDPHLSSTPTPEPHGHMLPYYRRHNYYLIAIICKKNQTEIINLEGRSAAHKTWSFLPIPNTWDLNRRPRRWPPRPNHLTKWPQTRWCTTRDLALSIKKKPSPNGSFLRYDVLDTKKSVTDGRTDRHQLLTPPLMRRNGQGEVWKRFATREVDGVYSREASGICLPGGGPALPPRRGSCFASPAGVLPDGLGGGFLWVMMVLISRLGEK